MRGQRNREGFVICHILQNLCAHAGTHHMHLCICTKESTHQLTAAGFLSVQKLPLRLSISMSGNVSCTNPSATSVPCRQIEMVKSSATAAQHL